MPDLVIRHIDTLMAERIKGLAKHRQWSINDVVLNALRSGLGLSAAGQISAETLAGHWDAKEKAAFHEAMQALSSAPATQLTSARRER